MRIERRRGSGGCKSFGARNRLFSLKRVTNLQRRGGKSFGAQSLFLSVLFILKPPSHPRTVVLEVRAQMEQKHSDPV